MPYCRSEPNPSSPYSQHKDSRNSFQSRYRTNDASSASYLGRQRHKTELITVLTSLFLQQVLQSELSSEPPLCADYLTHPKDQPVLYTGSLRRRLIYTASSPAASTGVIAFISTVIDNGNTLCFRRRDLPHSHQPAFPFQQTQLHYVQ